MSDEEWRPVVGWEGHYEVSSHGSVRRFETSRVLKPWKQLGYYRVTLSGEGRRKSESVARLVLTSFAGQPSEEKPLALHGDGVRTNNHKDNLRWGNHSENMRDAVRHGTHPKASRTHCLRGHEYSQENTMFRMDRPDSRLCRKCEQENNKARWLKRKGTPPPRHGTLSAYLSHYCRCEQCKTVFSEYQKERRGRDKS